MYFKKTLTLKTIKIMNKLSKSAITAMVAGFALNAQAQVKFKVSRKNDINTYAVSMMPEKSLIGSKNTIGTAQISLRVKSDKSFILNNLKSANQDADWQIGATLKSPDGSNDYDYISINLKNLGTKAFTFSEGKEIELFSFQNAGEMKDAVVELIDNDKDEFIQKHGKEFNLRNHISVLGFGHRNAYSGNLAPISKLEDLTKKISIQKVFPNPAIDKTTIVYENLLDDKSGEMYVTIIDSRNARELVRKKITTGAGQFNVDLSVDELVEGSYLVHIEKDGVRIGSAQRLMVVR
jgi:hypothetical protein